LRKNPRPKLQQEVEVVEEEEAEEEVEEEVKPLPKKKLCPKFLKKIPKTKMLMR
jgi:hypothetical protein